MGHVTGLAISCGIYGTLNSLQLVAKSVEVQLEAPSKHSGFEASGHKAPGIALLSADTAAEFVVDGSCTLAGLAGTCDCEFASQSFHSSSSGG